MSAPDIERLQSIKTLPSLVAYLKRDLDWPIETDEIEDVFFEYDPEELGLAPDQAAGIKEIKQLRPMDGKQPWGIFWISFEKKLLPVVMLRRILGHLVIKKRAAVGKADQPAWHAHDLLFISAYGEEHDRAITFAHFAHDEDSPGDLPVLKVLGWDDGDTVLHLADAHRTLSEKLRWPADPDNLDAWRAQWAAAFTLRHREVIHTTQELVGELARLATTIRRRADAILAGETDRGPMRRLYTAFKTALIHDLTEDDFADVIAQTFAYGLLAARFSRPAGIAVDNIVDMIPPTNPFLRELLGEFLAVAGRKRGAFDFDELGIQDVVELLNHANAEAVKSDFGNRARGEDPVIHFYEYFLKAYDKRKKVQRGVFYTPQPVVSYIVRSVHELLQTEFGLADGLADTTTWGEMATRIKDLKIPDGARSEDPFVLILDPATGTATFLVETIEVIFTHLQKKWKDAKKTPDQVTKLWNDYVPKSLLPRLYGYELMMAPYTIAHMKLGLKLAEISARLGELVFHLATDQRAHIYLTNALEPAADDQQGVLEGIFPALAHEAEAVNMVKKDKRFTVVIGNPPYSNFGQLNRIPFILNLLEDYKQDLNDKKINLDDDFIKFVRLSQHTLESTRIGVFGMITNNVFFDGLTHRVMRRCLMMSFARIWICDLHGSLTKREISPNGDPDENVFDIQQGVGITIMAKTSAKTSGQLQHADIWGKRANKYHMLEKSHVATEIRREVKPEEPYYFFVPKNFMLGSEYEAGWRVNDIFPVQQNCIKTDRDSLFIAVDREELETRIRTFYSAAGLGSQFRTTYRVEDSSSYDLVMRRRKTSFDPRNIRPCLYRPFDRQWLYYALGLTSRPAWDVMQHMIGGKNVGLLAKRQSKRDPFSYIWCANGLVESCVFESAYANNSIFPLFLHGVADGCRLFAEQEGKKPNLSAAFLQAVSDKLRLSQRGEYGVPECVTPEDFFHYIYAVLHSPTYRTRYAEFLKIDFPRLPLTSSLDLFRALANLGGELVALHLMESPKLDKHITKWIGGKNPEVEKVRYCDETVWTNKAQSEGFRGVPEPVWNFHIGGYQVCEKWLKDRGPKKGKPGRTLSPDDITHYHRIVVALSETIRLMSEIDQVIETHGGWPGAFASKP